MGDYNINLLNHDTHAPTAVFLNMMYSNGFISLITRPTRSTTRTKTLIDNILTNNINELKDNMQGIMITDVSDHYPIFCLNWRMIAKKVEKYISCRSMNRRNYEKFISLITAFSWNDVYTKNDTNDAFSYFHNNLKVMSDQAFPIKKIKKTYHTRQPWLTECLKISIKKKNKLYIVNKKHPTAQNEITYKIYKNKLNTVLKAAESEYYSKQLEINKHNMKKTWDIIEEAINKKKDTQVQDQFRLSNGEVTNDKAVISYNFNNFFAHIGPQLAAIIDKQSKMPSNYLKTRRINTIMLAPVTCEEVTKWIMTSRDSAPGYDEVKARPLQAVNSVISAPLAYIFNLSIMNGVFPDILKTENIIPLFKKEDSMLFSNYRPVSLLCTLSKLLEKSCTTELLTF